VFVSLFIHLFIYCTFIVLAVTYTCTYCRRAIRASRAWLPLLYLDLNDHVMSSLWQINLSWVEVRYPTDSDNTLKSNFTTVRVPILKYLKNGTTWLSLTISRIFPWLSLTTFKIILRHILHTATAWTYPKQSTIKLWLKNVTIIMQLLTKTDNR